MPKRGFFMNEKVAAVIFLVLVYSATLAFFTAEKSGITGLAVLSSPTVTITDSGFEPQNVTIYLGDTVTWQNEGNYVAVLWSNNAKARFTSPMLKLHKTFSFTYENIGSFKYVDVNFGFKKGRVTVIEKPAEEAEEKKCAVCVEGCSNDKSDCSLCTCPCYSDEDCDDSNPCTTDACSSGPIRCEHIRSLGCALGDKCYGLGEEILFNETIWTCIDNDWMSRANPKEAEKGSVLLSVLAILFVLFVILVAVFARTRPRHGKKRK
jgi:plastocyanin